MKKLVLAVAFLAVGAQAAKMETCIKAVTSKCSDVRQTEALLKRAAKMPADADCKMIPRFKRENTVNDFSPERAVFFDNEILFSVVTSNEGPGEALICDFKMIDLKASQFVTNKVDSGRMFAVTSTGHVAVITRGNSVQWLVNTENGPNQGKRFFNVKDISVKQNEGLIILTFNNGKTEGVKLSEALEGLNKYKQFVSGGQ